MNCQVIIERRQYSRPGPCQIKRGVQPIRLGKRIVKHVCDIHKKAIQDGKKILKYEF